MTGEAPQIFESVNYGEDGWKTVMQYAVEMSAGERQQTAVCSDSALHMSMDAVVTMTVYDTDGQPQKKVL